MSDTALNYLWLLPDGKASGEIPLSEFKIALDTCRQNPHVDKFLWLDFTQDVAVCNSKDEIKHAGLEIRNLRKIKAYAENDLFNPEKAGDAPFERIWNQVDLARLLVLQHCLEKTGYQNAFYSDLDMNVALNSISRWPA